MKSLRYLIGIVLALGITVAAVPAYAQKQYTLDMVSLETLTQNVPSGDKVKLRATFTNTSPQGGANSSFNALQLRSPYTITMVRTVSRTGVVVTPRLMESASTNLVKVEGLTSVGKGQKVEIEFEATVPKSCEPSRWNPNATGDVWSGSQIGSGQSFTLQIPPSLATTTTTFSTNSVAFTTIPTSIGVGVSFNVVATQTRTCSLANFPAVTLSSDTPTFSSGTVTTALSPDGLVKTTTFTNAIYTVPSSVPAPSSIVLTFSDGTNDEKRTLTVYADGDIACNETAPDSIANNNQAFDPFEPGQAKSVRQLWNSNAASCLKVPFDFTNKLKTDGEVILLWPSATTDSQKAALFRNTVTGKLRSLPPTSTTVPAPAGFKFGWVTDSNGPILADALMCLDEEAPRPYAKLVTSVTAVDPTSTFEVQWDPANAPVAPGTVSATYPNGIPDPNGWKPIPATGNFEFTIGDERFVGKRVGTESTDTNGVKKVTVQVVTRNVGSTPSATMPLPAGTFLLSVVMPIYPAGETPSVYDNKPVRMCVIANGIRMYVPAAGGVGSLPTPQYFQTLEYFDGDGWGLER